MGLVVHFYLYVCSLKKVFQIVILNLTINFTALIEEENLMYGKNWKFKLERSKADPYIERVSIYVL